MPVAHNAPVIVVSRLSSSSDCKCRRSRTRPEFRSDCPFGALKFCWRVWLKRTRRSRGVYDFRPVSDFHCCRRSLPVIAFETDLERFLSFPPSSRGLPLSLYVIGPMLGPILGSMLSSWILYAGWRWIFWALTMAVGINTIAVVCLMEETYSPYVLVRPSLSLISIVQYTVY